MKTFVPALLVALAGVASAQLADLPQCSLQCFLTALGSDGCSELTDFKCHCEKSDKLLASVQPCVEKACSADEVSAVISGVEKTCASAGVPIQVPQPSSAAPSSSAAPASSSAAESSAESSAAASSSAAETTEASATATKTGYQTSEPSTSASGVPKPSGNGTAPGAPSGTPKPTEFPGAASRIGSAAGLVGAAAIAFFAL